MVQESNSTLRNLRQPLAWAGIVTLCHSTAAFFQLFAGRYNEYFPSGGAAIYGRVIKLRRRSAAVLHSQSCNFALMRVLAHNDRVYFDQNEVGQVKTLFVMTAAPNVFVIIKPQLGTARLRLHAPMNDAHLFVRSSVCLSVCRQKCKKTRFSEKLSNLELWSLLTTYRKSHMGFSKIPS